jgi:hypothetical protein
MYAIVIIVIVACAAESQLLWWPFSCVNESVNVYYYLFMLN